MSSNKLARLKGDQLKSLAFLMGLPNSGTKTHLAATIQNQLSMPPALEAGGRVVSVDMGIRNLGICVLEASNATGRDPGKKLHLKLVDWKKLDLLDQTLVPADTAKTDGVTTDSPSSKRAKSATVKPVIDAQAFRPRNLSKTAVEITHHLLHSYKPSHILIEQQRFRSGGASAVQEWTLRVNMLESMLWASLETLRRGAVLQDAAFPECHEVSPERVARFWNGSGSETGFVDYEAMLTESPPGSRGYGIKGNAEKRHLDKREKIVLVRSWLGEDLTNAEAGMSVEISGQARGVANLFLASKGRRTRPTSDASSSENGAGKLDDLADSLLQGVTWIRWAENHSRLQKVFENGGFH